MAGDLVEQPERVLERRALRELVGDVDRKVPRVGQEGHALDAAHIRARHDLLDIDVGERVDEGAGLAASDLAQRTELVVTRPSAAAAGAGMAKQVDGHDSLPNPSDAWRKSD